MQTIIAATDFSPNSLNAVNYAADLAMVLGAHLTLFHVYQVPIAFSEVPAPVVSIEDLEKDADEKMNQLEDAILQRTGNRISIYKVVRQGAVVNELEDYCNSSNAYAVVMGSESANALERFLGGGRTTSAITHLKCPVISVPPGNKFRNLKKIGLACDFRNVVDTIPFREIKSLVNEFKAELHVLHVSADTETGYSAQTVEESGWLQEIVGELRPVYHFIRDEDIEKGICEFAEKNNLDLLLVIPKKHHILDKLFSHSHSQKMVIHSHVPVMSIHE